MLQLAEDVFSTRTDANQLSVDEEVMYRLQKIHTASLSEFDDGNVSAAWVLVFPI